jgi:hypothetical protein
MAIAQVPNRKPRPTAEDKAELTKDTAPIEVEAAPQGDVAVLKRILRHDSDVAFEFDDFRNEVDAAASKIGGTVVTEYRTVADGFECTVKKLAE